MRIVEHEQGSPIWHEWRHGKITASMAGTIMGLNPYQTPLQLYGQILSNEKTPDNARMSRGRELEPHVRRIINDKYSTNFIPVCVENSHIPWKASSLDGWNGKIGLEIKCPSARIHNLAKDDEIEPYYMAQVQHQMHDLDTTEHLYVSYMSDSDIVIIHVPRDEDFIANMLDAEERFARALRNFEPPEPIDGRDVIEMHDLEGANDVDMYLQICHQIKNLEISKEALRNALIARANNRSVKIGAATIKKIISMGAIDYAAIPELANVNLQSYRKPPITKWLIS